MGRQICSWNIIDVSLDYSLRQAIDLTQLVPKVSHLKKKRIKWLTKLVPSFCLFKTSLELLCFWYNNFKRNLIGRRYLTIYCTMSENICLMQMNEQHKDQNVTKNKHFSCSATNGRFTCYGKFWNRKNTSSFSCIFPTNMSSFFFFCTCGNALHFFKTIIAKNILIHSSPIMGPH